MQAFHFPKRPRVLVVDDNVVTRKIVFMILQRLGYDADVAAGGVEALDALDEQHYDAVLMDLAMPEMDGFETTLAIRQAEGDQHMPIVAITASAAQEDRDRCFDVGMDAFMSKPIDRWHLAEVLRDLIGPGIRRRRTAR